MHARSLCYDSVTGWSTGRPPEDDGHETLVLVFGAPRYVHDDRAIRELRIAYPHAKIMGCSTAGEIAGRRVLDETLSVAVVHFNATKLRLASAPVPHRSLSTTAGETIAEKLAGPGLRAVFVLSDGLGVNGSELLRGIHRTLPASVIVTGGLAGDGSRFQRTWILADDGPADHQVVAVGLYGDAIRVSHGSRGGWDIFGPERVIMKSEGSVLYELDGQPALDLYERYLGERAAGLPATALLFPLALRARANDEKTLVRTILAVDREKKSMTFAGDVPQGSLVQLMRANFERLIDGASEAARLASGPPTGGSVAIAISCVGRRLVLGERVEEEVEAISDAFPLESTLVGFYSYGEISPFAPGECGDLHNQTMTVTRFWET